MANEALCKVLCHNICCLIQSHYELGVEATFWGDARDKAAATPATFEMDDIEALAWV